MSESEDACGCQWVLQHPTYGDVLVRPCDDHATRPPDGTCGCRAEIDSDLGVHVAVEQCKRHAALSTLRELRVREASGYELSQYVAIALQGTEPGTAHLGAGQVTAAPAGVEVKLHIDSHDVIAPGHVVQTPTGRRYLVRHARRQECGKHAGAGTCGAR
jgi:hypothetical protein